MPGASGGSTYNYIMEELLRSALGSVFPGSIQSDELKNIFSGNNIANSYNSNVAGIKKTLSDEASTGSKALAEQRAIGIRELEKSRGSAIGDLKNSLTAAGLNKSGIAANSMNRIYENETDAKNSLVTNIAALDEESRRDAVNKLLGIESVSSSLGANDRQAERDIFSLLGNLKLSGDRNRMLKDELDLKKLAYEEGKTGFGGVIGSILGSLLGITGGGLAFGASDQLNELIYGLKK
ncbi:hypothetical protein MASR1M107_12420 [Ignavibacteriales bacterium]